MTGTLYAGDIKWNGDDGEAILEWDMNLSASAVKVIAKFDGRLKAVAEEEDLAAISIYIHRNVYVHSLLSLKSIIN